MNISHEQRAIVAALAERGALAALAVFFKFAALRLAGGSSLRAARVLAGLELLAAAFVAVLGAALFLGLAMSGQGS